MMQTTSVLLVYVRFLMAINSVPFVYVTFQMGANFVLFEKWHLEKLMLSLLVLHLTSL